MLLGLTKRECGPADVLSDDRFKILIAFRTGPDTTCRGRCSGENREHYKLGQPAMTANPMRDLDIYLF